MIDSHKPGKDKKLDIGKRSVRLVVEELKAGNKLLEIKRSGSSKETLYIPTPVKNSAAA